MKLGDINSIAEVFGEVKQNQVSINTQNTDKIVALLSTNLYSKPHNSFIREIVSNAWDSHVESGNENPVIVRVGKDAIEQNKIFVMIRDFGTGLSPERFDQVYRYMGGTTKDTSDEYIGCFGLGKFSALAVSDMVYVTSFYEGSKYEYLMYKNGSGINIDLLNTSNTDELNGLAVVVKLNSGHERTIHNIISSELRFFQDVFYINDFYPTDATKFNEYKLLNYKNFAFHNDLSTVQILLGNVQYPIDLSQFQGSSIIQDIAVSRIALKLNIGDLDVTPSRESLHYTPKTKANIVKKAEEALEELHTLKLETMKKGVFTSEDLFKLPSPFILNLAPGYSVNIATFNDDVTVDGIVFKYNDLYDKTRNILSRSVYWAEYILEANSFKRLNNKPQNLRYVFEIGLVNYNKDEYNNIEKKYIRQHCKKAYLRENWLEFVESIGFRRSYMLYNKDKELRKIFYKAIREIAKNAKKFDISGLTESFKQANKPKKREQQEILAIDLIDRGRHRFKVENFLNKNVVILDDNDSIAKHHLWYYSKIPGTFFYKVAVSNKKKLLKEGATDIDTWLKENRDKIIKSTQNRANKEVLGYDIMTSIKHISEQLELDPRLLKNDIQDDDNYSKFYKYLNLPNVKPHTISQEYKELLDILKTVDTYTPLGVKIVVNYIKQNKIKCK